MADLNLKLKQRELDLAEIKLRRRTLTAPFDGAVVQIHKRLGEWLQPGEKVLRLTRVDRLRVEGFVPAGDLPGDLTGATARFRTSDGPPMEAKIAFVSPEVNAVNNQVRVWAVIANDAGKLRPGQSGVLEIVVGK
ncbi:MAG: HlyD family efflux transporter periplasmic adaptor subunit [Pirellulales bacterium]